MVVIDLDPVLIYLVPMLILSLIGLLGSIFYLKKTKVNRTISKSNEGSILSHYDVLMNINNDQQTVIKSLTQKSKMLQKKIMELEGYEEEEAETEIDIKPLLPIAAKFGLGESQLQALLQTDQAKKFIKKNPDIIQSVLPLLLGAQNKQGSSEAATLPETQA